MQSLGHAIKDACSIIGNILMVPAVLFLPERTMDTVMPLLRCVSRKLLISNHSNVLARCGQKVRRHGQMSSKIFLKRVEQARCCPREAITILVTAKYIFVPSIKGGKW